METKQEHKHEEVKHENKMEEKHEHKTEEIKKEEHHKDSAKAETKTEKKVEPKVVKVKKDYALVNGRDLHMSAKDSGHICDMIRGKNIDKAIELIEGVIKMKIPVKMNNREVGHKHGKGIMGGRYPVDASKEFLHLLKQLRATAIYNELDLEKVSISSCYANIASKPFKRGGARFKRAHVMIKLSRINFKNNKLNNKKQNKENKK